ncbi:enoyl-CoA hydratase/isomerase family protein [Nisaea sediminum]|uniref:enoyl-CoA hydratase/isomerase family protein n=1 Tax=Nisaea sediminum TaxID=2775867 RepID=UPI00186644B4|nr:enoyl-CoA hydratase-related protein [Nisaea sediminum]
MAYETILYEATDGVARITLNRPEAGHAVNLALAHELLEASINASEDPDVRAVILDASGTVFGFGGDLKYFESQSDRIGACLKETTAYFHAAVSRLHRLNSPVVVAVQGMAAGAGFSLSLIGDIVLAAKSAQFKMAYTAAGLSPDGSSSYFLPRVVGMRRAMELMLTNRTLSADEAQDWGIVTRVVEDDDLADEATKLAQRFAKGPTRAYGGVKRLLASSFQQSVEAQMEDETRTIAELAQTEDGREGLDAFLNKRKPNFKGR